MFFQRLRGDIPEPTDSKTPSTRPAMGPSVRTLSVSTATKSNTVKFVRSGGSCEGWVSVSGVAPVRRLTYPARLRS